MSFPICQLVSASVAEEEEGSFQGGSGRSHESSGILCGTGREGGVATGLDGKCSQVTKLPQTPGC